MSIKRINEFPEGSGSLSNDDMFLFMDDPSGEGVTKKISLSELSSMIVGGSNTTTTYLLHESTDLSSFSTPTSVVIDGMSYNGGQVVIDSAFGSGSSRVALYSDSMFAVVAVDADIDTVYYNGETGSDSSEESDKTVSAGVSDYRGYYSCHNLISGDDPAIQQIVISKSSIMSGSNRSIDTNNDDFTVTGLSGSDIVIILNLYWNNTNGPEFSNSTTVAIEQFIDLVMFDEATPRTDINDMRTAFYDNSAAIKTAIENEESDLLYDGFQFYRSYQKVTPSGGSGSGAILEIEVYDNSSYDDQDVLVPGTGYQVTDTLTVSGDLLGGTTPTNDLTITVSSINGAGGIIDYTVSGTSITTLWPDSYIIDGDDDQYDIGNFIGTNRTRSTATVTLTYDPIENDGQGGNDTFQILTVFGTDKTISEGQWAWFEEDNSGAFINHTLSTIILSDVFQISSVDLHNGEVQTAQVLQFDNAGYQSVITGPIPASGTDSQRIIIQGQRAEGNGEGGDVYVWGGDSDVNGGDIKIYAGDADNVSPDSGSGGYVNIDGGKGATTGGNVEITAGYSVGGQAGDVEIVGGATSSGVAGTVKIKTNNGSNTWTFSPDGSLTLPTSGNITFSDGTTQTSAGIPSNTGLVTNSTSISNIVSISQANYDAIVTKDSSTLYVIS